MIIGNAFLKKNAIQINQREWLEWCSMVNFVQWLRMILDNYWLLNCLVDQANHKMVSPKNFFCCCLFVNNVFIRTLDLLRMQEWCLLSKWISSVCFKNKYIFGIFMNFLNFKISKLEKRLKSHQSVYSQCTDWSVGIACNRMDSFIIIKLLFKIFFFFVV